MMSNAFRFFEFLSSILSSILEHYRASFKEHYRASSKAQIGAFRALLSLFLRAILTRAKTFIPPNTLSNSDSEAAAVSAVTL